MENEIKSIVIQNILESIPVGILVINPDGEIVKTNRAASQILGYAGNMLQGKGWGDLFIFGTDNLDFNQVFIDVIREKRVNLCRNVDYVTPDGSTLHLSLTTSFLAEDDKTAAIVVLIHDMTEIHHAYEREKLALEEKHRVQQQRAESLERLALAVAHQIRNPVTAIGGFANLTLKQPDVNVHMVGYLKNILSDAGRLEDIVRAVSGYAGLKPAVLVRTPLREVVEGAKGRLEEKAVQQTRKVSWGIRMDMEYGEIDPDLFSLALDEIFLNSLEAFDGGEAFIAVHAFEEADGFCLRIEDKGGGILEKDMPYIFDPFFTTKAVGVGMGLCRAHRIISEHRGHMEVRSNPGKGTEVLIRIL